MRRGWQTDTPKTGTIRRGVCVTVLEARVLESGVVRCRFEEATEEDLQGWVSQATEAGQLILELKEPEPEPDDSDASDASD